MFKPTTAVLAALLAAGCASAPADKTPQTVSGRLNSCMLREIYDLRDAGKLPADEWTAAQETLTKCKRRLGLGDEDVNATQSLNIAVSVIRSLRPAGGPTAEK